MDSVTVFVFVITVLCVFSGIALSFFTISVSRQRRIYWRCAAVGAESGFSCGYPGVGRGLGAAAFVLGPILVIFASSVMAGHVSSTDMLRRLL